MKTSCSAGYRVIMQQVKITSHGKVIARLVPEFDEVEPAQNRLNELLGSMINADIIEPLESEWNADTDNL